MYPYFHVVHVASVFILFAICAAASQAPVQDNRKKFLMWSGIASLIAVLSGFGLAGFMKIGFPVWIWVKIFCWLFLSVVVGMFFRKPEKSRPLMITSFIVLLIALTMVYFKPF